MIVHFVHKMLFLAANDAGICMPAPVQKTICGITFEMEGQDVIAYSPIFLGITCASCRREQIDRVNSPVKCEKCNNEMTVNDLFELDDEGITCINCKKASL